MYDDDTGDDNDNDDAHGESSQSCHENILITWSEFKNLLVIKTVSTSTSFFRVSSIFSNVEYNESHIDFHINH